MPEDNNRLKAGEQRVAVGSEKLSIMRFFLTDGAYGAIKPISLIGFIKLMGLIGLIGLISLI